MLHVEIVNLKKYLLQLRKLLLTKVLKVHLAYFTEVKWLISKKTIIFQGSRGGGGPTFSRGGGPIAYSL